jgi:hypothetical protein
MGKIGAYAKSLTTQSFQKVGRLRKNENCVINLKKVKKSIFFQKNNSMDEVFFQFLKNEKA